jgi:acyl-coenzyme A synthetase/AMP-(fatty) acid ligase
MILLESEFLSTVVSNNILTDSKKICSYRDIPLFFQIIKERLVENNITITDCLALTIDNSLDSILLLLYLLKHKYNFLLLPWQLEHPSQNNELLPSFCRYQIKLENDRSQFALTKIVNPNWHQQNLKNKDPIFYLFTSGSTGKPKLVAYIHHKLINNAQNCCQKLNLTNRDRIAITVPIFHMYGLAAAFIPAILVGASIDLQANANVIKYLDRERDFNPNIAFTIPSFCQMLLKVRRGTREYKFTVVAGDRLPPEILKIYEAKFGTVIPLYGTTEMGAIAAASDRDSLETRISSVGKPLEGVKVKIENNLAGGEIYCQHPWSFEGYADDRGNLFGREGEWFCTKDWGEIQADGYLKIFGRSDRSVNRDGVLVFFSDIERALASVPGIASVVVESKGENARGKAIVAYCILNPDSKLTERDILQACGTRLLKRAIPERIFIISTFPLLPNGKIDRVKLREN